MNVTELSPEARIVLLSAGGPENDAAIRALLRPDLDLERLYEDARWAGAIPALRKRLRRPGMEIAAEGQTALEMMARRWEFRLLHLERQLHRVLDRFSEAGVEVLLLKGAGLAYTVHGAFTERPMNDIDLLVRPEQADAAWKLAQEGDWRWDAESFPDEKYRTRHHAPPLNDRSGNARLEIHSDLYLEGHPFRFSAIDLWQDAQTIQVEGRELRVPSLQRHMLYSCIHFAWSHKLRDKAWLTLHDVHGYVETGLVDWDAFVELARKSRAGTCAYWTLRLARNLARVRIPDRVIAALRPPLPEFLLRQLERRYAVELFPSDRACPSVTVKRMLWRTGLHGFRHVPGSLIALSMATLGRGGSGSRRLARGLVRRTRRGEAWIRYLDLGPTRGKAPEDRSEAA